MPISTQRSFLAFVISNWHKVPVKLVATFLYNYVDCRPADDVPLSDGWLRSLILKLARQISSIGMFTFTTNSLPFLHSFCIAMNDDDDLLCAFGVCTDPSFALPSKTIEALSAKEEEEGHYGDVALCHQQTKELLLSSAQTQGVQVNHKQQQQYTTLANDASQFLCHYSKVHNELTGYNISLFSLSLPQRVFQIYFGSNHSFFILMTIYQTTNKGAKAKKELTSCGDLLPRS